MERRIVRLWRPPFSSSSSRFSYWAENSFSQEARTAHRPFWLASSIVYALAVFVLKTHFSFRYGAFLFMPVMLSVFSIPAWWAQPAARRGAAAITALLLVFAGVALVVTYRSGAKIGDWKRVSDYLDANVRGPQPILVFEAENAVPLAYYYKGPGRIVAVPNAVDFRTYDVDKFVLHNPGELKASLAKLGDPPAIWLVTAGTCRSLNVEYGCDLVNSYVAAHYRTVKERHFFHATVRLLVPRANATALLRQSRANCVYGHAGACRNLQLFEDSADVVFYGLLR